VREAEARALAVSAQVQAADIEMQIARQALAQTTGWNPTQLPPLHLPAQVDGAAAAASQEVAIAPLPEWLATAARDNLLVRTQTQALALAEQEAAKAARAASTKVDVVSQAGGDHLSGSGRWGAASNAARQFVVGVQIQVPLFTGGQQDARQQELLRLRDKAQAELDSTHLAIAQQVHATWLQLQAGAARTVALESAHRAAQSRLEATQLGREVGDRTTLELLQAQNDATLAASNLLQHRVRRAQDRLHLLALAGRLNEAALQSATDADRTLPSPKHP
jgi:outer membrane protein